LSGVRYEPDPPDGYSVVEEKPGRRGGARLGGHAGCLWWRLGGPSPGARPDDRAEGKSAETNIDDWALDGWALDDSAADGGEDEPSDDGTTRVDRRSGTADHPGVYQRVGHRLLAGRPASRGAGRDAVV
jgi:hypothetical protein